MAVPKYWNFHLKTNIWFAKYVTKETQDFTLLLEKKKKNLTETQLLRSQELTRKDSINTRGSNMRVMQNKTLY